MHEQKEEYSCFWAPPPIRFTHFLVRKLQFFVKQLFPILLGGHRERWMRSARTLGRVRYPPTFALQGLPLTPPPLATLTPPRASGVEYLRLRPAPPRSCQYDSEGGGQDGALADKMVYVCAVFTLRPVWLQTDLRATVTADPHSLPQHGDGDMYSVVQPNDHSLHCSPCVSALPSEYHGCDPMRCQDTRPGWARMVRPL